ncbi:unnamed protein product [Lasius platythorax]|uniref:Tropomyosin n=1 Tax=Lasius platythorax TaxID=488582 RepID=A0AAV2NYS2_9HYME
MSPCEKFIFCSFSWKLMFVDILGRIKQWSGIVQNKLNACKSEIDNLRKELLARACQIDVKMREMEDLKAQITDYQNALPLDGESSKKDHKTVRPEQKEESIRNKKDEFIAENSKRIDRAKDTAIKNTVRAVDQIEEGDEENAGGVRIIDQAIDHQGTAGDAKGIDRTKNTVRAVNQMDEGGKVNEERARAVDEEDEEESLRKRGHEENNLKEAAYITMAVQTTVQEKTKRESELESEIIQLRKEYNRIIKERAEYENAIQRALLRGVSSLNVEALRVLRCPPIPCCTPCAPCPATAGIIPPEPVVPCPAKSARRRPESAAATMSSAKVPRDRSGDQADCATRRPCASPCCIAGRSRKSADDSMIFLLRQSKARNLYDEDSTPVCGSTIVKKIELPPLRKFET